jgi:predicted nucleic acid-binding protein
VLDTSVLLSGARGPLIALATHRAYTIVWSGYMEAELRRKLLQIGWRPSNASVLLEKMEHLAQRVDHEQIVGGNYDVWLKDLDDHPVMATAIAGRVDYLVTWNTKDFPPKKRFAGITIITPDAFLRLFDLLQ